MISWHLVLLQIPVKVSKVQIVHTWKVMKSYLSGHNLQFIVRLLMYSRQLQWFSLSWSPAPAPSPRVTSETWYLRAQVWGTVGCVVCAPEEIITELWQKCLCCCSELVRTQSRASLLPPASHDPERCRHAAKKRAGPNWKTIELFLTWIRGEALDYWIGCEYISCKCFALKRTCSKCFAGRVVKCFALLSLPRLWDINALLWVD